MFSNIVPLARQAPFPHTTMGSFSLLGKVAGRKMVWFRSRRVVTYSAG